MLPFSLPCLFTSAPTASNLVTNARIHIHGYECGNSNQSNVQNSQYDSDGIKLTLSRNGKSRVKPLQGYVTGLHRSTDLVIIFVDEGKGQVPVHEIAVCGVKE